MGAAIAYLLVMYVGVLWDSLGPGSLFSTSCPGVSIFIISSIMCICIVPLLILWYIIAFEAYRNKKWFWIGVVASLHLVTSYLTLINTASGSITCIAPSILLLVLLVVTALLAVRI